MLSGRSGSLVNHTEVRYVMYTTCLTIWAALSQGMTTGFVLRVIYLLPLTQLTTMGLCFSIIWHPGFGFNGTVSPIFLVESKQLKWVVLLCYFYFKLHII